MPDTTPGAFDGSFIEYATLHVPEASLIAYNNSEPWKNFKDIVALTDSDPNPSSIMTIEVSDKEIGSIYDLNGRKLKRPSKGLYIKNGKKYLVK